MEKTYHFMAGLPRSGSTVLAALLNQHPDIYASPQNDLLSMLYQIQSNMAGYESYKAGLSLDSYEAVLNSMANNFYSHIEKPIIIDKNRGWGTPYNWNNLSGYVSPDGKVILTLRPILEILASFMKVIENTEKLTGYPTYLDQDLWATHYRDKKDAQIENLMRSNGEIDRAILSVANLLKNHRDKVFVVWFNDLIEAPQETMNGIYDFLGLDRYSHDFDNIEEVDPYDDLAAYNLIGLHDINSKLRQPDTKPEDYLSDYVIKKYGNALDFLSF
jgi:sulfotransferase